MEGDWSDLVGLSEAGAAAGEPAVALGLSNCEPDFLSGQVGNMLLPST